MQFLYLNRSICKDMFLNLYRISYSRFCRLKEHYEEHGLSQRVHGNCKRLPPNTLPQAVTEDVKNFLTNYAEENAILLPGRIPRFKTDDIRLLSSCETKMNVWHEFQRVCEETGKQGLGYTSFTKLWQQFHPDLLISKPMTDLCLTCQQNTSKLVWSANLPNSEKSQCVLTQQEHLDRVQTERELYRNTFASQRTILKDWKTQSSWMSNTTHAQSIQPFTIHSTLLSKYTFPATQYSHDLFTLKLHANAESSVSCVRQYLSKLITLLMRQVMLVKGQTPQLATFVITSRTMD